VRVVSFAVNLPDGLVAAAREELLDRGTPDRDAPFRWGYLLGVDGPDVRVALPLASRLDDLLREQAVPPEYSLSFLKTSAGRAPETSEGVHYDGFHLDTHPEIVDDSGPELARVLINLAPERRTLRIAKTDRFELAARGLPIHRGDYQVVDLPDDVETGTIDIPPIEDGRVHALQFFASVIPHVGVDNGAGHFLASYEAVARP
jgi:hypothetical protein